MLDFASQIALAGRELQGVTYPEIRKFLSPRWGMSNYDNPRAGFSVWGTTDMGAQVSISWPSGSVWEISCNGLMALINKEHLTIFPSPEYGWSPRIFSILMGLSDTFVLVRQRNRLGLGLFYENMAGFAKAIQLFEALTEYADEDSMGGEICDALTKMSVPFMITDPPNPQFTNRESTLHILATP